MVKKFSTVLAIILSFFSIANGQVVSYASEGLVNAAATFSPALLLTNGDIHYYINGQAEYFFEKNVSIRSDLYFLNSQVDNEVSFKHNSSLQVGPVFHYTYGHLDTWFGFQPGISITKINENDTLKTTNTLEPILGVSTGLNFYVSKYFHFFISANYVHGQYYGMPDEPLALDEVRALAGLGFNFHFHKFAYWENHVPEF